MALKFDFYKEIFEKEKIWLTNLGFGLLNVYYLPELLDFYFLKQKTLTEEAEQTDNSLLTSLSSAMGSMIIKLNEFINLDYAGKEIDLKELNNYFITNILCNNLVETKTYDKEENKLDEIVTHKSDLYELRQKLTDLNNEDYIDDDFYYGGRAV